MTSDRTGKTGDITKTSATTVLLGREIWENRGGRNVQRQRFLNREQILQSVHQAIDGIYDLQ
jgi:hypothetical protein